MQPSPVVENVAEALIHWNKDRRGMVVAVSGGPDSIALFRALLGCDLSVRPERLVVAHLNHQLRGSDSDADETFVRDLAAELQKSHGNALDLCIERIDVRRLAAVDNSNLENMARRVRYDWLVRVARERDLPWVATGHTADDQAETVLHRLLRGSGIKGLRGIAPRRELAPGILLMRPLLGVTRDQVLAFLSSTGQAFQEDRSNQDISFTRNRIRKQLLPLMAQHYNPRANDILCRLAVQADELFDFVETTVRQLLEQVERPRAGTLIILDRQGLAAAPPYLVQELFRLIWEREGWSQDAVGFDDWTRLAALVRAELPAIDLPGRLRAQLRERVVQVGPVS